MFRYLLFLLFTIVPVLVTLVVVRRRADRWKRPLELVVLPAVAVAYTLPWDAFMIARGVWGYGTDVVWARLFGVPVGELTFVVLQCLLVVLWVQQFQPPQFDAPGFPSRRTVALGAVAGGAVGLFGWLLVNRTPTYYLGWLLLWAAPVLAVQWGLGLDSLWKYRRTVVAGAVVPTAYLTVVDRVALELDLWILSDSFTTGLTVAGLPVEEGAFFSLTTVFLVQGVLLYRHGQAHLARSSLSG